MEQPEITYNLLTLLIWSSVHSFGFDAHFSIWELLKHENFI